MARKRILLDVDTGTDDALAILYAMAHPELDVAGISCVAGNAALPQQITERLALSSHPAARMVGFLLQHRRPRSGGSPMNYSGLIGDAGAGA